MASHILTSRRFLPLFITQFLGAFNDNFFKTAVVILVTYRTSDEMHIAPQTLVTISGALFILPYTMFCATAGKLADKFDKARIAWLIKLAEVAFMVLATAGFIFHQIGFLFTVLFCMGAHSAFFSPVKYALLPEQLHDRELMEGNSFIEAGTFIAILMGTIAGGILVLRAQGEMVVSAIMLVIAVLGVFSSRFIPSSATRDASVRIRFNIFSETAAILVRAARKPYLFKSMLTNSWFWFVCMTFLTQCPAFTREVIGANEDVVTMFLTSFSVGIGIGAVVCGALLKGKVSTRWVPWSGLAMSLFTFDLYWTSAHVLPVHQGALLAIDTFLAGPGGWRMVMDLFYLSFAGGFYIVPLYAIIQQQSEAQYRAQMMACNNVINAFFMVASAFMALGLFALKFSVAEVFLTAGLLNTLVAIWLFTPHGRLHNEMLPVKILPY